MNIGYGDIGVYQHAGADIGVLQRPDDTPMGVLLGEPMVGGQIF